MRSQPSLPEPDTAARIVQALDDEGVFVYEPEKDEANLEFCRSIVRDCLASEAWLRDDVTPK